MKLKQLRSVFLLLTAAILWGTSFVAQSVGMDYIGPFTYLFSRSLVGSLFLIPVSIIYDKKVYQREHSSYTMSAFDRRKYRRTLFIGGFFCGVFLTAASALQQIGIQYTTVGKAGFITALYIVIVPILGLFLRKKCGLNVWISVMMAVVALYLLCITENLAITTGDALILICSFVFALHILVIDHFSPKVNGVFLSLLQFSFCTLFSGIAMVLFEAPALSNIIAAAGPILYAGILSSGVAYTCQIVGQNGLHPAVASLILSLESAVAVLAGWVVLDQALTIRELIGCSIMFAAILLAQFHPRHRC